MLQHTELKRPQYALHHCSVPASGKIPQMAPNPNESNIPENYSTKRIQYIVGLGSIINDQ